MRLRPRLTVRSRLTLLYTGLFAACGAILVTVSYTLVAQLGTSEQGQKPSSTDLASIMSRCRSQQPSTHVNKPALAQCISSLEQQLGAQHQRSLTLSHLLLFSLITLAAVIALAAILGWIFAGRSLRPVHRITAAARAASEHNLSARVALHGPRDELSELAETFDEMLSRLQAAFESQRQFIANASHELRTPLAVMRTSVDVVLNNENSSTDDLRSMGEDIRGAVDHAEHLIGALLILARSDRGLTLREEVDLAAVAENVLEAAGMGDQRIHARLDPAVISGDPVLAERLVGNLLDNAVRYNSAAGDIWISTSTSATCQLTVENTGPVISLADVDRIFQPFQRLSERTSHEGSGLGLAIVASIAAIHGGAATARPRKEGGLTVTVTIPSASVTTQSVPRQESERSTVPQPG
ncbi:MAG TPA: HAMP domain-containing sensor histidine kinase [Acidimicrobiales bacterium]|jgi:signal transduction histidine kinase|nr:HAMP domain-containing sensor histidine kinase [Acidimicrobiales bacterium]